MSRALVVVDVQNDFCEGGSLAVDGGGRVAADIDALLRRWAATAVAERDYTAAVATKDHHVDPGDHFSPHPDFSTSWPRHCVVGTDGESFHPALDPAPFDAVFTKGEHAAAYSGFEGRSADGATLAEWLRERDVDAIDVCGLATDYCVRATALDGVRAGFDVRLLGDLCAGVAPGTTESALVAMSDAGVRLA